MCQKNKFKIALCQTLVEDNKENNIKRVVKLIEEAVDNGAKIISLGEMFNCPYRNDAFKIYAEEEGKSETLNILSSIAKEKGVYIIGGSVPEKEGEKYYNTSFVFDKEGKIVGKHRKVHLFDIDIKDRVKMKESDTFSYGKNITVFDTQYCKVGIAICYDMRFPEIFRIMVQKGVKLIIVPAAFNYVTGPAHWEIIIRGRAMDNQVYFCAVSPARNENESYLAYGHSIICDPFGKILGELDEKEGILYSEIDLDYLEKVRSELPLLKHRRLDLYSVNEK
ncbi:carbon-nitrogen hydrolase family protein [Tepidibacter formicigenes]|jgi:predicted amidohydrolase|uniref:Predicted amidohydrolase n=1 Tax=Tepidibacter formicigenes DSM 15518 TaxID=1123349 RepID=A0A1M6PJ63_9FIRM|nr:carbon-nitrogen hydrolase family protein [Tepidibacter formicigenes]SHK07981.1 Predicted amidohydrolase [Tepidibacter formicigenes DSM 15518]